MLTWIEICIYIFNKCIFINNFYIKNYKELETIFSSYSLIYHPFSELDFCIGLSTKARIIYTVIQHNDYYLLKLIQIFFNFSINICLIFYL